jgi:hypothetical protein
MQADNGAMLYTPPVSSRLHINDVDRMMHQAAQVTLDINCNIPISDLVTMVGLKSRRPISPSAPYRM